MFFQSSLANEKKKKKKGHTWVGIQSPPVLVEVAGWSSGNKNDQV